MQHSAILLLGSLTLACGYDPEVERREVLFDSIVIADGFTDDQVAVIEDSVDGICNTVRHCFKFVDVVGPNTTTVKPVYDIRVEGCFYADGCMVLGQNHGEQVLINLTFLTDPISLWSTVTHELLHFGIIGHTHSEDDDHIMDERRSGLKACIDQDAVDLWCEQLGCEEERSGSCE